MCGLCFGFFEGRYISRHQNICKINSSKIITSLPMTLIQPISNVAITDDFKMKILAKFRVGAVGKMSDRSYNCYCWITSLRQDETKA